MSSITNGGIYVIKDIMDGKYSKVKIVQIDETDVSYHGPNGSFFPMTNVDVHFKILKGGWESPKTYIVPFSEFDSGKVKRKPNCWKCQQKLNEVKLDICEDCGWIKCPDDNACGCGYVKEQGA